VTTASETKDYGNKYTATKLKHLLKQADYTTEEYSLDGYFDYTPEKWAVPRAKKALERLLSEVDTLEYILYLTSSDKSNFRFKKATTCGPNGQGYKEGRGAKPHYYQLIREYYEQDPNCEVVYGMEADDAMAMHQHNNTDTIICTQDKDLRMVPGEHYNFVDKIFFTVENPGSVYIGKTSGGNDKITGTGICWFYAQMLLGDKDDNIPKIPFYGAVKVEKLLRGITQESEMIDIVWKIYYNKFKDKAKDRFLEVADLLWMLRNEGEFKSVFLEKHLKEVYNV
tara:strand:- start:3676 stop:4521 length:846 start_codon:yes stop_codon:yes gene_type:complete